MIFDKYPYNIINDMKTYLITVVSNIFKFLWFVASILILAHMVFIIIALLNLKIPACAEARFVDYPVLAFWTEADAHYGRKSPDGTIKAFQKSPFDFNLQSIKDTTDILHVTTVTGKLTVDINDKRDILLVVFLKRISFLLIFLFIAFHFDRLFSAFRKKEPFNPNNVVRLKTVAYLIMLLSPIGLLFNELTLNIFKSYQIAGTGTIISHNLNIHYIFLGLLILIIAFAFDVGSQLQKESEYTI